jgi:hypothetical protein
MGERTKLCDYTNTPEIKLFQFSLRGKAKEWLHPLPTASINSWDDLK